MRAMFLRVLAVGVLAVALFAVLPAQLRGQRQPAAPRGVTLAVEPIIATKIEALLATPNAVLVADYYHVDMRFGPSLRIDAMIVEAPGEQTRQKGLRVQVRDNANRSRQEGTSYMDIDELTRLVRGLASMAELAAKWTGADDRRATELSFTSAGGFRLAIRQSARLPRVYLSTGLLDPVVTSIELVELETLKQAFEQALAILNDK
jgi:hypothetical protein